MSPTTRSPGNGSREAVQLATFYLGDHCLALEIDQIQEIMREVRITRVPHAAPEVSGVINLRGEVSTVIDLRRVLRLPPPEPAINPRTLIVRFEGESIGLIVDRVADITTVHQSDIVQAPPNLGAIDGPFIRGVCPRDSEIIVVLDLEHTLSSHGLQLSRSA